MFLYLYKFLSIILYPFIVIYLYIRLLIGKEHKKRISERFGYPGILRPEGKIIWIHASSIGESLSILPVIEHLTKNFPFKILVTTTTVSSERIISQKLPQGVIHQFIPIDNFHAIKRFLNFWKPSLTILTESEIWPNLVIESAKISPLILLNARMSPRSFVKWQRYPSFFKKIGESFSLCMTQSKKDAEHFTKLGLKNVTYTGNLKFTTPPPEADKEKFTKIQHQTLGKIIITAASTHNDEEKRIAKIFINIKTSHPNLLLIITPRHPKRSKKIVKTLKKIANLKIAVRSKNEDISPETDIYIADTFGEYGIFYRLSQIVFIGGSLINHGGQNLIEPAKLGNAIIFGPFMQNFSEIVTSFLEQKAAIQINNENELEETIKNLLTNPNLQNNLIDNSSKLVKNFNEAILKNIFDVMNTYLK